jgi:CheY-like chemotaxis protein
MNQSTPHMNHVVLADDDQDHGIIFKRVLQQVDDSKSLTIVNSGEELLHFLSRKVPDLLFLDLNMPCKNGFECLTEIRKIPELKVLPIVVYSGSCHMSDIQRSYLYQADLYMVKPFNSVHLKNALESILKMEWKKSEPAEKYYFINNRFVPFTA